MMKRRQNQKVTMALGLSLCVLAGCEGLLDVDLPASLTNAALEDPTGAPVILNSVITHFEDGFDLQNYYIFGREESGEVYLCGPMCSMSTYDTGSNTFEEYSESLRFNFELRSRLEAEWTVADVPDRARMMAQTSLYEGAVLSIMGSKLCEVTLNGGTLQTPGAILDQAEASLTRAISEINAAGDFALMNGISTSALHMAQGLRAQVRWFKGDNAGALTDASSIPQGFVAYATREPGPARQNRGWTSGTGGGFMELYDPIDWWIGLNNPVTGTAWPAVIPFTGWTFLGILADGRAIGEDDIPIRTKAGWHNAHGVTAGAVVDTRVSHTEASVTGKSTTFGEVASKFTGEGSDIPLVNWAEMVLIRAEIQGGQEAIDRVNELRTFSNLPQVTYADAGNAQQIKHMIWEERRRELFNEGRFFYTKLKNLDELWFPRDNGGTRGQNRGLTGGVRYTMPSGEYVANENLTVADKATGCATHERPVNPA